MSSRLNRSVDHEIPPQLKASYAEGNCYCSLNAYKRYDKPLERIKSPANYPRDMKSVMHKDYSQKAVPRRRSEADIGRYAYRDIVDRNNTLNMRMVGMKHAGSSLPQNYATISSTDFRKPSARYVCQTVTPRRDAQIFPRPEIASLDKRKSEYKSKYRAKSFLCHNSIDDDDDARPAVEAIIPIGRLIKPWSKPSRSVERTTIYKNDFHRPMESSYLTKNERDCFKNLYFSNRNGELITKPNGQVKRNTIYKGDYIKPRRDSELVVPRINFQQPNTHKDLTQYFLGRLPHAKKLESDLANYTTYKKAYIDHHIHACECPSSHALPNSAIKITPRKPRKKHEECVRMATVRHDLGSTLKRIGSAQTKKCFYRSLVRPSTGKFKI